MEHNLLVFSDVHLGCDLVQHARPHAPMRGERSERRDEDLVAMLRWYRERPIAGRPWRLVIAGDFIDFVGMSVTAPDVPHDAPVALTDDDRLYGLGNCEQQTVWKLGHVVAAHEGVFQALADFVAAGNELVVIRGNHDIDLHWPRVQKAFRQAIVSRAGASARKVARRIRFSPWFHYEKDHVYIEHGHQYDPYCSHACQLRPLNPVDPTRSSRSLADVLKRYVVNPTTGLTESGHEDATLSAYILFGIRLGIRGGWDLARRFFGTAARLLWWQRQRNTAFARHLARSQRARLHRFARRRRISVRKVRALARLWRKPILNSVSGVLSSLMLDRALFALLSVTAIAVAALIPTNWVTAGTLAASTGVGCAAIGAHWWRRRASVDASSELRLRAQSVAGVLPAALVVMGHTHLPERSGCGETTTYVNLGSWAEGEGDEGLGAPFPASRTHLVIEAGRVHDAELRVWDPRSGPSEFVGAEGGVPELDNGV